VLVILVLVILVLVILVLVILVLVILVLFVLVLVILVLFVLVLFVLVLPILVLVVVTTDATEPVVGEGEHHMQIVVLRCLYDIIKPNESVLLLVDLDRAVLVEDLEPYAILRNFGNVVESP